MPTYEYVCSSCGHEWEADQRITADALKTCPKCSNETAKRQVSGGSFILKGGGWYADLYSSAKPAAKTDSGAGAGASKSTAPAKTDSSSSSGTGSSGTGGSGTGGSGTGGSGSSGSGSGGSSSGSGSGGSSSGGSTPSST